MVYFAQQFKPYLLGRRFTLRTDHGSLTWLKNFKEPEGQLARWLERLQEFDCEISHRRGRKHTNADALSRRPCRQCGRESHSEEPTVSAVVLATPEAEHRKSQLEDDLIGPFLRAKEANKKPGQREAQAMSPSARRLSQIWDQLVIHEDLLYRRYASPANGDILLQLVVPKSQRADVLRDLHEGVLGGHLGQDKTLGKVKERFYWPGYHNDVKDWVNTCQACAARKTPMPKSRAPLQSIKVGYPMRLVAADILGPLPESDAGNSYILVVGDYFTRWMEAYPIPIQEAATVAKKMTDEFFLRFSPPEQLHTDQGRQFESELVAEVCKLLGIDKTRTTAYHPQSDGLIERFNRTLLSMLATAANENPFNWEEHLRPLCMAYNTSVQSTTGFSPFSLMFGRQARMPIDVVYGSPNEEKTPSEHAASLRERLESAYQRVREQMSHKLDRQKEYYNRKVHGQPYSAGDLVWLHAVAVPRGRTKKFHRPWTGPYKIMQRIGDTSYRIQDVQASRHRRIVHFDRLKPCPPGLRVPDALPSRVKSHPPPLTTSPPGTNLTLIPPSDAPNIPRYPQRNRRPPCYLYPVVSH